MKDKDKNRFQGSISWFNQFFDGLRQIYEHIADLLPQEHFHEGFSLSAENYYFPRYKTYPSIPPYYALTIGGKQVALQVVAVIDSSMFSPNGPFSREPSLVVSVFTQPERYAWVDEYGLNVIRGEQLENVRSVTGTMWGKITSKYPAEFFAFQAQYDRFSDIKNPPEVVQKYIIDPMLQNLEKGFQEIVPEQDIKVA
jgi:hypothetical protein